MEDTNEVTIVAMGNGYSLVKFTNTLDWRVFASQP